MEIPREEKKLKSRIFGASSALLTSKDWPNDPPLQVHRDILMQHPK
jgi:hypothetical protein